jgi:hypothetical protein
VGSSPEEVLERGRRRFELATVEFPFKRRLMVMANYGSSLAALRVKMGPRHPGESSCVAIQAREAIV